MIKMRGIYTIPLTPYKENLEIDFDDFRKVVEFSLACGSHGITGPLNASEVSVLSKEEREKIVELTIKGVNGAVPVVIGCTGSDAEESFSCVKFAEDRGADAVVVMPPTEKRLQTEDELYEFYGKVNDLIKIPIYLQNFSTPLGTPMTAKFMVKMIKAFKNVLMIKEETEFSTHLITRIYELTKDLDESVYMGCMGGKGGKNLMTDHARGACGDMPSCHSADIIVDMWDLLEIGKADIAMDIYEKILLLLDFENVYRLYAYKEILSRRGIIKTNKCRPQPPGWFGAAQPIDKHGSEELDMILAHVSPYFRVK